MPRAVASWLVWWVALFWLWMLLVGDWNHIEWIGGAAAATVAATIATLARRASGTRLAAPSLGRLRQAATALGMVFVDFGILTAALLRSAAGRHVVRGRYVVRPIEAGPKTTPAGKASRAWTVLLAGYSPNAYVVDIDVERGTVLLHDLVPFGKSEEPA